MRRKPIAAGLKAGETRLAWRISSRKPVCDSEWLPRGTAIEAHRNRICGRADAFRDLRLGSSGAPSGHGSTTGAHGGEIPAFSLPDQARTGNLESSLSRVIG